MVPLLLILLVPELLADQVCFNISDSDMNINTTTINITDSRLGGVTCMKDRFHCIFQCEFSNMTWFSGSSICFNARVTRIPERLTTFYSIEAYGNCSSYGCMEDAIVPLMESLNRKSSDKGELNELFFIRQSCRQLFSSNHRVKKTFINVERRIIHNIMETSNLMPGTSMIYNLKDLSLNVVNISETDLSPAGTDLIPIEAPQLLAENGSTVPEILLPVYALRDIPQEERIVGLVSYMQPSQFQFEQEVISSMVIRIELLNERRLHDLTTPVQMIFRVTAPRDMDNDSRFQCCYFDEHDWGWKSDGCETLDYRESNITCNCKHTTPFSVLLIKQPIAEAHWKILSYISYIGCGLSAFFTALSLLMYVFSRKHQMDYSFAIHASLSGALFLLNSTFLLTEWGSRVGLDWVCVFVAAVLHYSLLCCFTWMAIEALHLYLLLIKVFNTYYKHYLVKLSLVGWGIPGVIVTVSLGMKDFKQFYGVTQMTMTDTNQTNAICWITDDSFFYSLNLVYFIFIFVFNSGILVAVASRICKMKQVFRSTSKLGTETQGKTWKDSKRFSDSCKSGLTVLGLTCLMGTTWGLAFLGSGYVNYPVLYLFCILNSAQGFFIFIWVCQSARKQRRRDMEERMTSTPTSSGIKSD
ncbi:adhesion G-protein coupled receptor G2 [Lates calcarifer]|uniref:Adhesion G-protein coupled receptor G2 n=1 Tax=Lates calcarifer TaxID=8187 RepID=A0A4W6G0M4_LATCA|nr:adhesion G-protein coupled receptor G2 [Lates calcarifer]